MIRVLLATPSVEIENAIRSSASLEFAGRVDAGQTISSDLSGDVLLIEVEEPSNHDWREWAELPLPVLLLMDQPDSASVTAALRQGIRGVISLEVTPQEIESAVHAAIAGLVVITPAALAQLLPDSRLFSEGLAEPLSPRELEVLDLVAEGLSNKLIAQALNISEHTVKTHIASIFTKLGASSRTEVVSQAIRRGLVML